MSEYPVLKDLAIIFAVSLLVILVFHRFKLPALPGFIVAGVLLGPNALGLVSDVHQVERLAEVGVILLLFTIGIEFSLSRLREMGRPRRPVNCNAREAAPQVSARNSDFRQIRSLRILKGSLSA